MQLVASIAGAQILVNTVGYVEGTLRLGNQQYGWTMAAFGIGATVAPVIFGTLDRRLERTTFVVIGASLISVAILPANFVSFAPLMLLWLVAGAGQSLVNLPTQTLIADRIPTAIQGRVYGAHFAWSHLWWAVSYPLAGWLGITFSHDSFLYSSLLSLLLLVIVRLVFSPHQQSRLDDHRTIAERHDHDHQHRILWHEHTHRHDEHHQHEHRTKSPVAEFHTHIHCHAAFTSPSPA